MSIISDNTSLIQFCHRLSESAYITVDTEFIREKTYWPKLCLVQLANESEAKVIDVLAEGINLDPLLRLMTNSNVLKVFHAARQDLEIFFNLTKEVPYPFFDTQIAAMVCGFGDSVSYEALVRGILDTDLDKSSQFTDWSVRPLTAKQINYAIGDVTHLLTIYKWLTTRINASNRYEWLEEEVAKLSDKRMYLAVPEEAWRRIKIRKTTPRFLALLRELAAWRELEAQKRDLPRNRILRDDILIEIARQAPLSSSELYRIRNLNPHLVKKPAADEILKAVEKGKSIPDQHCPRLPKKPRLPHGIGPTSEILKVLLKMKCNQGGVAQKLIANSNDIEKIAAYGSRAKVSALDGWRYELFGKDALNLLDGKLALIVKGQKLELINIEKK